MSGHPQPSASPPVWIEGSHEMTAQEVDVALSALARASTGLLQECEAEQQRMEELNALSEAAIGQPSGKPRSLYDAESVHLWVRLRLAIPSAKAYRDVTREFVCWWADAAVLAWKSAIMGTPLLHARWGAGAPETLMSEDELAMLPPVDEHTRRLVELAASLGSAPPGSADDQGEDLAASAADMAARAGLRIRWGGAGEVKVVDGDETEARRRRLWGESWLEHRIPSLPEPDELDLLLARTPPKAAERVRAATRALIQAAAAGVRIAELEDSEAPWNPAEMAEYDQLSDRLNRLTALLADYAGAVTDALPAIRAMDSSHNEADSTS